MYYHDGNHGAVKRPPVLASGPVPHTSHSIHYCPMTEVVSTPLAQNRPIRGAVECSAFAKMLPALLIYLVAAKVNVCPSVWDGMCLGDAAMTEDV